MVCIWVSSDQHLKYYCNNTLNHTVVEILCLGFKKRKHMRKIEHMEFALRSSLQPLTVCYNIDFTGK